MWDALAAIHDLRERPDVRAVQPLICAARRDRAIASEVSACLIEYGVPSVYPLFRSLKSQSAKFAVNVLSQFGQLASLAIFDFLSSSNPQTRRYCASLLGQLDDASALPARYHLLTDSDCGVRSAASFALARRGIDLTLEQALALSMRCPHDDCHIDVYQLAPFLGRSATLERLSELLRNRFVGSPAALLLGRAGDEGRAILKDALRSSNVFAVQHAARAARMLGGQDLGDIAAETILDGSIDVALRRSIATAIGAAVSTQKVSDLIRFVSDPLEDVQVRRQCLDGLFWVESSSLEPLCHSLSMDEQGEIRSMAIWRMPTGSFLHEVINRGLRDTEVGVRMCVLS